jgi:hypothetical protein
MPPAYEVLLLNTAIPQIQAAQTGDTYVVPRDIAFSAALTLSAGTANGVPYLNGSKVLTTGSALTFDGATQTINASNAAYRGQISLNGGTGGISQLTLYQGSTTQTNLVGQLYSLTDQVTLAAFRATGYITLEVNSTEKMRLDSSGNLGLGGSAQRATTVGTAALNIFNGTAPVGTLANGVSFYSAAGEAYVMDAAGNATLLSPHDSETNEWIFRSKHTPSGKVLRIDVERLLRFVNTHFGLDAVKEFVEE